MVIHILFLLQRLNCQQEFGQYWVHLIKKTLPSHKTSSNGPKVVNIINNTTCRPKIFLQGLHWFIINDFILWIIELLMNKLKRQVLGRKFSKETQKFDWIYVSNAYLVERSIINIATGWECVGVCGEVGFNLVWRMCLAHNWVSWRDQS